MKKLNLIITLIGLAATIMLANVTNNEKPTAEDRATFLTNQMKDVLKLKEDQIDKVQEINLKSAQKIDKIAVKESSNLAKLNAVRAVEDQKAKDLKAVLSKKQYKKYTQIRQKLKEKVRNQLM
ncbi:hypothetical protein [Flammeovirga agarivorans]|uniref:LTXXQ motif family protein n=1 Tax=Flammeovirga agarivorans TaxID=2726742 RepID=A0A7X8SLA1_9BACT|nr:hypothetical protein [Flammeovirga agarivorans]NLR92212.1 hypothetical protein [Flammeovirga agarivorans]